MKPQNKNIKSILKTDVIEKSLVKKSSASGDNFSTEKTPSKIMTTNVIGKDEEKIKSLTGQRQIDVNKVFISDFNAAPALAYVDLKISSIEHASLENSVEVRALHDSGCAKSSLKTSVFNELLKKGKIKLLQPVRPMVIITATGENHHRG